MQALILVGGAGTRLRPLTNDVPKPAITLVDRPFIRFMVDWLARHGVDRVVMACGFRAEDLRSCLGDSIQGGPSIAYIEESEPLGTAGPIRLAADEGLLDERFLVLNGDVLTDLDLGAHIRAHTERDALASLALYEVDDPSAYGLVRTAPSGAVEEFLEKPGPDQINGPAGDGGDLVNAGAYVLERDVVRLIPPGRAVSIEREVFPRLVGQGLYGLPLQGYWMDIGTPERYLQASWDILEGTVETEVSRRLDSDGFGFSDANVDVNATLAAPTLIDEGSSVGAHAIVGPRVVLGRGCTVAGEATVHGSVLLDGCELEAGASVNGSILAPGVFVGAGASVAEGSVVGADARIEPGVSLAPGARLEPGTVAA
jgi:mannose-1-phosphate guanylyltransferase